MYRDIVPHTPTSLSKTILPHKCISMIMKPPLKGLEDPPLTNKVEGEEGLSYEFETMGFDPNYYYSSLTNSMDRYSLYRLTNYLHL